ncbi:hypothetical protein QFZ40_001414 [Arthrobacter pascens]|uniref:hypothetical protein n=1 Tax=Arthrobacter pascens TaxID=1677 RepID=UPI00278AE585|nr:hypothetical protein [Arthrobacter pascens]MDQ0633505.1 hypothetical protein [Arthrobacter pascens]
MQQESNQPLVPGPAGAVRPVLGGPPAPAQPHPNAPTAPTGHAPVSPGKRGWWSIPKILIAAGVAVLLAGGGGGAIGYSMAKSEAAQQFSQRFQNGRQNGANGQRRAPGTGRSQPTDPATPGSGSNP